MKNALHRTLALWLALYAHRVDAIQHDGMGAVAHASGALKRHGPRSVRAEN